MYKQIYRLFLILITLVAMVFASGSAYAESTPPPQTGGMPTPPPAGSPAGGVDDQVENFDCSQVTSLAIDQQVNLRASLIRTHCGLEPAGNEQLNQSSSNEPVIVANYGGTDVQVNNALADTYPHVIQSTSSFATKGQIVVAAYNSSTAAPSNYSGISYSLDGGATFTELRPSPFATGHGTNYGDPIVIYSNKAGQFYTFWLCSGADCGSQGLGSWSSANGINWSIGTCVHIGTSDDRENAWVDNNPSSPYYGRIYVTWNDFNLGGALVVAYSTDNGTTWSPPVTVNGTFIRNVQGVSASNGSVFLATMNEGGGGTNPRQNWIYSSTNGGGTWSGSAMGSTFPAPGDTTCGYFRAISPIWRYMGWGNLGVGPGGVLHYAYTSGDAGDIGNIYYIRSTDSGLTWSAPMRLNTDAGTRAQWMPSLAVTANGRVFVSWYDRRNTANNDYQRYARVSLDNGTTWESDQLLSDQIIPQPAQPDPNINTCYAGDYDYATVSGMAVIGGWTDGRVSINSTPQQDVYADRVDFTSPAICVAPATAWQLVAGLPIGVYGPAVATDSRYVYSAGGYDFSIGEVNQFVRYNPMTNQWTSLAPLPTAVHEALSAYVAGKIYVFGGLNGGVVQNLIQIYNIASNSWSTGAAMPEVRQLMGGGSYGGKIYLVGGYNSTSVDSASTKNQTWVYDPAANSWATLAPLPSPLGGPASAIIGGQLYIAGGRDAISSALNTLYAYNIAANSWSTLATLPTPVNVAGGALFNNQMWVMGGGTPFLGTNAVPDGLVQAASPETMSTVQIYNPATNSWSAGPTQNVSRSFQGAAVVRRTIISVGGYDGSLASAVTESFLRQRLNVLLVYADGSAPVGMQTQLLGLPGVAAVDLFGAQVATPTPAQLQNYDLVVTWSNYPYNDPSTLGSELADYVDNGGVVVELSFDWYGQANLSLSGRWLTGGYAAFSMHTDINFTTASLGTIHVPGSPLLVGVGSLSAYYRELTTVAAGATPLADWSDTNPLLAIKGHAVGVTGYFGDYPPNWSGDIGRIITNTGFSLRKPNASCNNPQTFLPIAMTGH